MNEKARVTQFEASELRINAAKITLNNNYYEHLLLRLSLGVSAVFAFAIFLTYPRDSNYAEANGLRIVLLTLVNVFLARIMFDNFWKTARAQLAILPLINGQPVLNIPFQWQQVLWREAPWLKWAFLIVILSWGLEPLVLINPSVITQKELIYTLPILSLFGLWIYQHIYNLYRYLRYQWVYGKPIKKGDFVLARQRLNWFYQQFPNDLELRAWHDFLLVWEGKLDEALDQTPELIRKAEQQILLGLVLDLWLHYAQMLNWAERYDESLVYLEAYLRCRPYDHSGYQDLAWAYLKTNQVDQALALLEVSLPFPSTTPNQTSLALL